MKKYIFFFMNFLNLFVGYLYPDHMTSYQYDITVGAIFQNEAPYLKEWIDYHKSVGVDHFVLYNHFSKDNYEEVLYPYINKRS